MPDIKTQKITLELPKALLEQAKAISGKGTTETIRDVLREAVTRQNQQEFLKLRGTLKVGSPSIEEMRSWED